MVVNTNDKLGMRWATQHLNSEFMILITSLLKRGEKEAEISLVARIIFPRRNIPKAFTLILNLLFCFVFIAAPFPNPSKMWQLGNVIASYSV